MATIDQQFVEYIVKTLVNNPDKVTVERKIDEKGVLLSLTVDPEDVGRVIGRRGATAQSLRTLLRALGTKNDARYNLKITNDDLNLRPRRGERPGFVAPEPMVNTAEGATDFAEEAPAEPAVEAAEAAPEETSVSDETFGGEDSFDDEASDLAEKTRAELADMDDLDI